MLHPPKWHVFLEFLVEKNILSLKMGTACMVKICPWIFIFIPLVNIFSVFLILFIYIINIGYWQVLFITLEQSGKSYSATSTLKCRGSTAAVLVITHVVILLRQNLLNKFCVESVRGQKRNTGKILESATTRKCTSLISVVRGKLIMSHHEFSKFSHKFWN